MSGRATFATYLLAMAVFNQRILAVDDTTFFRCSNSSQIEKELKCKFEADFCGWREVDNANVTKRWERNAGREVNVQMDWNDPVDTKARLMSNMTCVTENATFTLRLKYSIKVNANACALSVFRVTNDKNFDDLFSEINVTSPVTKEINVTSATNFKVLIQVKKFNVCGNCDVWLYETDFKYIPTPTTATSTEPSVITQSLRTVKTTEITSPSTPENTSIIKGTTTKVTAEEETTASKFETATTEMTAVSTQASPAHSTSSQKGGDKGTVSVGAIIGIIVGVLALTVVVCVVVILLLRRKAAGRKVRHIFKKLGQSQNGSPSSGGRSDVNSAHIVGNDVTVHTAKPTAAPPAGDQLNGSQVITSDSADYYKIPPKTPNNTSHLLRSSGYEVTNVPEASFYYSVPKDEGGAPILQPRGKAKGGNPDYELATVVDSAVSYSLAGDVDQQGNKTATTPIDTYAKVKKAKGDNYNKLSFPNPRFAPLDNSTDDSYNHLQDQDNVYKVPRSDGKEALMAGKPDKKAVRSSPSEDGKSGYVNVSMKGKGKAPLARDVDYNHLSLKDGRPAISTASQVHGQSQDVYNHLNDQSDEYNRVDFDGRALHITGDESVTYNHLAEFQE